MKTADEYKIEIWKFHRVFDTYISNDINKVLKWYEKNYKIDYDFGRLYVLFI